MAATPLDTILSDSPVASSSDREPLEAPEPTHDAGETPVADELGADDGTPATVTVATGDDDEPGPSDYTADGLRKALVAERKLRKDERKRAAELQQRVEQLLSRSSEPPAAKREAQQAPTAEQIAEGYWTDPANWTMQQVQQAQAAFERRLAEREAVSLQREVAKEEREAARRWPDFEDARKAFIAAAHADPRLVAQMVNSEDRTEYAYRAGKALLLAGQIGEDPDKWREAEREKIRAELAGEDARPTARGSAAKSLPPKTIATARGTGAGAKSEWAGPTSLESILGK